MCSRQVSAVWVNLIKACTLKNKNDNKGQVCPSRLSPWLRPQLPGKPGAVLVALVSMVPSPILGPLTSEEQVMMAVQ